MRRRQVNDGEVPDVVITLNPSDKFQIYLHLFRASMHSRQVSIRQCSTNFRLGWLGLKQIAKNVLQDYFKDFHELLAVEMKQFQAYVEARNGDIADNKLNNIRTCTRSLFMTTLCQLT